MDGFQPYTNPSYQAPQPWANANVYAPWDPDGAGMQAGGPNTNGGNPFSGYGETSRHQSADQKMWFGDDNWTTWPFNLTGAKKRPNITYNAPSYQGNLFTPTEGLPQYYGPSTEGGASNQNLMGMMGMGGGGNAQYGQTQSTPNMAGNNLAGGFYGSASGIGNGIGGDYTGAMPSFIGQSPWGSSGYGNNGGGSNIYGGSGGTQGSGQGTSLYQPYVPTGGSGSGWFAGYGQY